MSSKTGVASGVDTAMALAMSLVASIKQRGRLTGMSPEDVEHVFHQLVVMDADTSRDTWAQVAEVVIKQAKLVPEMLAMVDYDLRLEDAWDDFRYVDHDVTEGHYPSHGFGKTLVQFADYHLDSRREFLEDLVARMAKDGRRPATPHEMLAFHKANPEFYKRFRLIALGQEWTTCGQVHLVAIDSHAYARPKAPMDMAPVLECLWQELNWNGGDCFLAVDNTAP